MGGFNGPSFGGGFDSGFRIMSSIFPIVFVIIFIFIIGMIIYSITRHVKNASSPQETTFARIVSKRMDVRHYSNHNNNEIGAGHMSGSSRTYYYITLEFDNGSRKEFLDVKNLFGLVAEGDTGYAATQGEWIVAFERSNGDGWSGQR